MMVPCDEEGKWHFAVTIQPIYQSCAFMHEVESMMNTGWELHGDIVVGEGKLIQAFTRFEPPEYDETDDDDDGLPIPEPDFEEVKEPYEKIQVDPKSLAAAACYKEIQAAVTKSLKAYFEEEPYCVKQVRNCS